MLKKLRIKFVAIIMASVAVVLAIVFTGICVSEYQREMSDVSRALSSSIDRVGDAPFGQSGSFSSAGSSSGMRPDGARPPYSPDSAATGEAPSEEPPEGEFFEGGGRDEFAGPRIGGMREDGRSLVPVAVYAYGSSGSLDALSDYTTALIDDDVLAQASEAIKGAPDGDGEIAALGLLYQKRTIDGVTYVAFADSAYASGWQSLALMLVIAGILTLAAFFVVALLLSKWALKPVDEAWTAQRQFVADASHELKTPLTVVLANTSILLKHPESTIAGQSQWIESTQVEAERMQGLVNEMLELAQVESRTNLQHEPLDFSELVAGETLQFESVAFERGCRFEESVVDGVNVSGDGQRLRKMTSTLIENALKYVDDGGVVEVVLAVSGATARLSIRNSGSTIAPEDLPHIFDRFYRTDKARTSGAGGYGLGLAIAREIAREHDGDITCASNTTGTTFTVTLPIL